MFQGGTFGIITEVFKVIKARVRKNCSLSNPLARPSHGVTDLTGLVSDGRG